MAIKYTGFVETIQFRFPAGSAAGNAGTYDVGIVPYDAVITEVRWIPDLPFTGNNTNSRVWGLFRNSPSAPIFSTPTPGIPTGETVQNSPGGGTGRIIPAANSYTLPGMPNSQHVNKGERLVIVTIPVGSGQTDPGGIFYVTLARKSSSSSGVSRGYAAI